MNDSERASEIERLLKDLSAATARKTALLEEATEFAARIHEIRAAFGNPFSYSHPENADDSVATYTRLKQPRSSPANVSCTQGR